jgi:hypothetical protein
METYHSYDEPAASLFPRCAVPVCLSVAIHGVTRTHKTAVIVAGIVEGRSLREQFMRTNQNLRQSVSLSVCLSVVQKSNCRIAAASKSVRQKKKKSRPCAVVLFRQSL